MERISVGLPQLDTSPSATSTASLNNMASTIVVTFKEPAMARHLHL